MMKSILSALRPARQPMVAVAFPHDANLPDVAQALAGIGYVLAPTPGGFIARKRVDTLRRHPSIHPTIQRIRAARFGGGIQ